VGPCLDTNVLSELACGTLDPQVRQHALEHLDGCRACRMLAALAAGGTGEAGETNEASGPRSPVAEDPRPSGRLSLLHALEAEARVGTTLRGKYTLDAVVGVGGMAVVYAVTHRNRKRFALKMLHPDLSKQASVRERFLREGYVANTVGHPGAVAVLDDDVDENGTAYLVMELLDGRSLDTVWRQAERRLVAPMVTSVAVQLLDVLAAAHDKGIVHRDIKPANLFLTADGRLKVLDFGIARLREGAAVGQTTNTGQLAGTPAFMAPEQAAGRSRDIDGQTDVWAVGATMFTLLTGRIVHDADNANALLIAAATLDPPSLASIEPDAPPDLCAVIDKALAREKAERWPSAHAMLAALRKLAPRDISPLGTDPTTRGPGPRLRGPSARVEMAGLQAALAPTMQASAVDLSGATQRSHTSPVAVTIDAASLPTPGGAPPPVSGAATERGATRVGAVGVSPLAASVAADASPTTSIQASVRSTHSVAKRPAPRRFARAGAWGLGALGVALAGSYVLTHARGTGHAIRTEPATPVGEIPSVPASSAGATSSSAAVPTPDADPSASSREARDAEVPTPLEPSAVPAVPSAGTASDVARPLLSSRPLPRPAGTDLRPHPSEARDGAATGETPASAPSSDCFYFDANLGRLVARSGCR
jgi:serine/threonine-protein kinase